jgi:hypothetical protein
MPLLEAYARVVVAEGCLGGTARRSLLIGRQSATGLHDVRPVIPASGRTALT